jgi:hypothetical protein
MMQKKMAVACFKILLKHVTGETKENNKKLQDSWSLGQDLNI